MKRFLVITLAMTMLLTSCQKIEVILDEKSEKTSETVLLYSEVVEKIVKDADLKWTVEPDLQYISYTDEIESEFELKEDGTLWVSGYNAYGILGDGTTIDKEEAVKILDDVAIIATQTDIHSDDNSNEKSNGKLKNNRVFALKQDRTLWAWGNNEKGLMGKDKVVYEPVKILDDVMLVEIDYSEDEEDEEDEKYTDGTVYVLKLDGSYWGLGKGSQKPFKILDKTDKNTLFFGKYTSVFSKDNTLWLPSIETFTEGIKLKAENIKNVVLVDNYSALLKNGKLMQYDEENGVEEILRYVDKIYSFYDYNNELVSFALDKDKILWEIGIEGEVSSRATKIDNDVVDMAIGMYLKSDGTLWDYETKEKFADGVKIIKDYAYVKEDYTFWLNNYEEEVTNDVEDFHFVVYVDDEKTAYVYDVNSVDSYYDIDELSMDYYIYDEYTEYTKHGFAVTKKDGKTYFVGSYDKDVYEMKEEPIKLVK